MSHSSRRGPPIECPLASLGRNTPSLDTQTYHHPLSSSPLNPQVYQMSRKSPLLNIGSDDIIYSSSNQLKENNESQDVYTDSNNTSNVNQPYASRNSHSQRPYIPPPLRNYTPIESILAYHDRLSPVAERSAGAYHLDDLQEDNSRNNNVVIVNHHDQYFLEDKMDSLYTMQHSANTERYYLEDNMDNLGSYSAPTHRIGNSSPAFLRRASSPSETSGSDRYLINRGARKSPAILSNSSYNFNSSYKNHGTSSSAPYTAVDGVSSLGRFSPSLDQGYATLVSPSPSSRQQTPGPWNRTGQSRTGSRFDSLSDELIVKIFQWLTSCELCNITRVCRRFESLAWKPVLWKNIVLKGIILFIFLKLISNYNGLVNFN